MTTARLVDEGGGATIQFSLTTAGRIIFGRGTVSQVGELAASMGSRAFIVMVDEALAAPALKVFSTAAVDSLSFPVTSEPTTESVREGTAVAREAGCDVVIAVGGGSVIDTGKAIAALLTNGGDPLDYLEMIGRGQPLTRRSVSG